MKKRITILLILALVLLNLSWLSKSASAAENKETDFEYVVNDDGVTITDYVGTSKGVIIPDKINNLQVTAIGEDAFSLKGLTSVKIPNGVKIIYEDAFAGNQLTEVTIPSSVERIERDAFAENRLLNVKLQDGLKTIGMSAFEWNLLTKVEIPKSVTNIEPSAFYHNSLVEVIIQSGGSPLSIGTTAFYENRLKTVKIPSRVETIGIAAFGKNKLTSVTLEEGITNIKEEAFAENQLTSVTIPKSVKSIGKNAFSYNQLKSVIFKGTFSAKLIDNAFNPQGSYKFTFGWYTDSVYKKSWDYLVKSPLTIYAKWQIPSLSANNVSVTNNIGNDKIALKGLKYGFTYTIYTDSNLKNKLTSFVAQGTTQKLTVKQVGAKAGALYIVVSKSGYINSYATKVPFKAQPTQSLNAKNVKVTNAKKQDTIKLTGLKKGTTYIIYKDAGKKTKLASFKATSSTKTVTVKQLGKQAGKIYITVQEPGYLVSAITIVSYSKEK